MDRDNLAKIFVEQKNKTPLDEFDGLSPEEMYHIVYFPFSDECSIQVNSKLDNSSITHAPIFKIVLELLSVIAQEGGLKLTSKGNIQPQIVKEIYNKKYLIDYFISLKITSNIGS